MSGRFVGVHIEDGCDLRRLAECFEKVAGYSLMQSKYKDDRVYLHTYTNRIYFAYMETYDPDEVKEFIDDDMPFSRLPTIVSFEPSATPPGFEERLAVCRDAALRLAKAVFEELGRDCIVTESMERRIACFKSPDNHWM